MKVLPCNIVEDLLPLYYDGVCSQQSRSAVKEHLDVCPRCASLLQNMNSEIGNTQHLDDTEPMKKISKKIKADKLTAFLLGVFLISIIASVVCFIAFQVKGSYVGPDGMLVESFEFIPIAYFFAFSALGTGIILMIRKIKRLHKYKG